jgi:mono/diheme cytochrome c family protein
MNCHNVKGMENAKPISIDLSTWASKTPNQLDFGFIETTRTTYHFLHQKLMAPRSLDRVEIKRPQELMIMPQYDFSEEQIELIMTAVLGMTAEKPNAQARRTLDHNEWLIENGRWLVKELNCVGCHINEGEGGAIRRTMDDEKAFLYPPSLDGVGTKVRSDWLHSFLRRPGDHLYRYWLEARMPTYTLSDTELNALTQYFALRDKQPYPYEASMMDKEKAKVSKEMLDAGEKLVDAFRCLSCHAARSPEQGRADPSVAVNLNHVKERMRVDGLYEWLKNPAHVTPGVAMPAFWVEDQPSPLTDILGGDSKKQIEAVKQYLLQYNGPATLKSTPLPPAGSAPAGGSAPAPAPEPAVSYE